MGDIPTPTKEKIGKQYVDDAMDRVYFETGSTFANKAVGYADLLEAVHFIQNYGVGRLAYRIRVKLTLELQDKINNEPDPAMKKAVDSILFDLNQGDFTI